MKILVYISAVLLFASCEKVISVEVEEGEKKLIVDGFLTNGAGAQKIKLTISQPYFESATPTPAIGASVKVISSAGDTFVFVDNGTNGEYIWTPVGNDTLCKVGLHYTLEINYNGSAYQSYSNVPIATNIDSIVIGQGTPFGPPSPSKEYYAELFATDSAGQIDYCWVKTYKNDTLFSDASSMLLVVNATTDYPGADGFQFIFPVRLSINDFSNRYQLGDSVKVEILSINEDTWRFLGEIKTQLTTNDGALGPLFAIPTANVRTNISKTSGDGIQALGWFSTSALSSRTETVK